MLIGAGIAVFGGIGVMALLENNESKIVMLQDEINYELGSNQEIDYQSYINMDEINEEDKDQLIYNTIDPDQLGDYVKNRGMKRQYYKDMVIELLKKKPDGTKRSEIDSLLIDMIPKSSKNPFVYIGRLLNEMKEKDGSIHFSHSFWFMNDKMNER